MADLCENCGEACYVVTKTRRVGSSIVRHVACRSCGHKPAGNKKATKRDKSRQLTTKFATTSGDMRIVTVETRAAIVASNPLAELIDLADIAKLLGVEKRTVQRYVADGKLPPPITKFGRPRWFAVDINRAIYETEGKHDDGNKGN